MNETSRHILFISYDGMTDPLGQSQVIPYLQGLSRNGYSIHLLSCEKKEAFARNKSLVENMLNGYTIQWHPMNYTKKPPVLSTLVDILKLKRAAKKIHRDYQIHMVHTRPGVPALVGLWMKKKLGVKFLNDIREFYADSRVEGHMWNLKNPLYKMVFRYFKRQEAEQVRQSDGIVCLTYAAKEIVQQWPEYVQDCPLEVIPCSADLDLFDRTKISETGRNDLKAELKIENGDHIVSYLGSIGGWYLTEEMMRFCKILLEQKPGVKFLFISPHRHEEIAAAAQKAGIPPDRIIMRKATRQQVPVLLSLSEFSVFFIRPCYSKLSSSPTKHGEIMAMGIPLVTNSGVGDVEAIVHRYDSGIIIRQFSETDFRAAADAMVSGKLFDPVRIREGAREFYSLETAIEKYNKIYHAILNH
ncbi:MAG: glycosyltransferase [Chitinophagaceae bacterium]|nr:glycosyltransferase [Chitinophagaceae bacterium]